MDLPALSTIQLSLDDAVLVVELHRPDALNALTTEMAGELKAALQVAEDPAVRAVLLTGAGRAFSSGADLKANGAPQLPSGHPDFKTSLHETFNPPIRQLRALAKPVVAAVNGACVGVAVGYVLACDAVVIAPDAYLLLSFLNVGLVPDGGASVLVPARAGVGRFTEMAMEAKRIGGEQAHAWGLADHLADDARAEGLALARRLAQGPTSAQAAVKQMVNAGALAGLDAALDLEAELQGHRGTSPEFLEGVTAFLQKRAPDFRTVQA